MRLIPLLIALNVAVQAQQCDISAASCQNCTSISSYCGWCDGDLYINSEQSTGNCIDPTTEDQWSCDGVFKSSNECDCETSDAPTDLVQHGVWRGFRIDSQTQVSNEVNFQMSVGDDDSGAVTWVDEDGSRTGSVVSVQGCDRTMSCTGDQFFLNFGKANSKYDYSCTYRIDWQSGQDAHTIAMGCNNNGTAPDCYDGGDMLFVFWACMDAGNCPFSLSDIGSDSSKYQSPFPIQEVNTQMMIKEEEPKEEEESTDSCGSSTCGDCVGESDACGWCIGTLFDASDNSVSSGASCFATTDSSFQCQGTTLTDTCTVYKCPWYEYYLQDPSTQGDCSGLTCSETTGDDPDFVRTNTPAMAYSTEESCAQNCVDPTTGCNDDDSCSRTYTCNASSTCNECSDNSDIPTHFMGIQMSVGEVAGIWTLDFNSDFDLATWTSPSGAITTATISDWLFDGNEYTSNWITTSPLGVQTVHATRMYISTGGALAQNSYLAISPDTNEIAWGQSMASAHNGTEYALLTCTTNANGTAISGLSNIISCQI